MKSVSELCLSLATNVPFDETLSDTMEYPDRYKKIVDSMINQFRIHLDSLQQWRLVFLNKTFENEEAYIEKLKKIGGDIPDGIINTLSQGIFDTKPSNLNTMQAAIIKVVAVYICIQY